MENWFNSTVMIGQFLLGLGSLEDLYGINIFLTIGEIYTRMKKKINPVSKISYQFGIAV